MEEYKAQRKTYQKDLLRQFTRIMEAPTAKIDLDDFIDIVNQSVPIEQESDIAMENPLLSFPSHISKVRAFVFACTATEENNDEIQDYTFLSSCNRYALESPVPSISTRCALYGNSREIMNVLEKAEEKYGKNEVKVDSKTFVSNTMGLPPNKKFNNVLKTKSDIISQKI